ncbi:protein phosphatase 1 regulatory subunit 26 [Hippocampus zosterae]|uniref:protein phosphatase 1 regulatory subunit 26 n=1 Tax=Hippocampus zosterae TaxID=109293 RepID=UPI00223D0FE0|nr:protein phosphatase 1 regulatory subunit 26 [Hippocampus zosterae]
MYLMNAPTVAAPRTEWRACGPPGGYSIPVCFNDSDAELSARGSSISNKVQMIIESLRSSQSSPDMSEEVVANALQRQDGPPQACKAASDPLATAKSQTKKRPAGVLLKDRDQSSDSDDSVDKGIEEAILEYLKEKDGHKRQAELFVQSSRQTVPEVKSESRAFSIMRSRFPKSVIRATPATGPVKKYIKHKASLHEAALRNSELGRIMLRDQSTNTVTPSGPARKIKGEDVGNDSGGSSSSDDGIEEAIQKYQLERIEQQTRGDLFKPLASVEESHSSSDDGIEEAIRSYQLEQLREKCVPKPQDKSGSSGLDDAKRHRPQKKRKRAQKAAKLVQAPSPTGLADSLDIERRSQGDGLLSFPVENLAERPTPAVPKANTTAELMCAEAILDISKTVMPAAFVSHLDVGAGALAGPAQPSATPERDSDGGGSVDSEDGIEQEIMKFLEQKAQMLKRSPGEASRGKPPGLSFTKRRKNKDNASSRTSSLDPSSEPLKAKSPPAASPRSRDKTEQSGDKSSSLDSDEDLDAAIKALLKTKKKSKKLSRSQRDSTKRPALGAERSRPCAKTARLRAAAQVTVSKKARKRKSRSKDARGAAVKTALPNAPVQERRRANRGGADAIRGLPPPIAQQVEGESSSVDSDDSIEQEIRKFLAEKVSEGTTGDAQAPGNGTAAPVRRDLEREDQPAEIPRQSAGPAAATPDGGSALAPQRSRSPGSSAPTEQKPPTPGGADDGQSEKVPAVDQSVKWRQSFGLPVVDPKTIGRTQFHISSSKTGASLSAASWCQGKAGQVERPAPATPWSSARHSWSAAKSASTPATTPAFNPFSVAVPAGRHRGAASTVHVPRDKSVFVELESGRTNHVQVQSGQSDEGKASADRGAAAAHAGLQGAQEEFIDQSEGESPEKKRSTLSLSYAIDPGIVVQPCIALSTEERRSMFQRRYRKETTKLLNVKRKLQFVPTHRKLTESRVLFIR